MIAHNKLGDIRKWIDPVLAETLTVRCHLCGEELKKTHWFHHNYYCKKCHKAVMYADGLSRLTDNELKQVFEGKLSYPEIMEMKRMARFILLDSFGF